MSGCLEVGLDSRPSCQKLCLKSVSVKICDFILRTLMAENWYGVLLRVSVTIHQNALI